MAKKPEAGMADYLREAFLFRWNLLFFLGGTAAAALTPLAPVLLPLVGAGELAYLAGLISVPRFRAAIDAKVHARQQGATPTSPAVPAPSLATMLSSLPAESRSRFERLHGRCVEMRGIAAGVRGTAGNQTGTAEDIRTPGLDRLLWLFGPQNNRPRRQRRGHAGGHSDQAAPCQIRDRRPVLTGWFRFNLVRRCAHSCLLKI